jgi:hypothetical protein
MTQEEFTFESRNKKIDIMEMFRLFHNKNPHVYTTLLEMARKASKNGSKQCSIKMLFEVLRWRTNIETDRIDEFKISNSLTAPYARHIMAENPELVGIFNLKTSVTDDHFYA